jgi:hypothetical protein
LSKTIEPPALLVRLAKLTAALRTWIRPAFWMLSSFSVPAVARIVPKFCRATVLPPSLRVVAGRSSWKVPWFSIHAATRVLAPSTARTVTPSPSVRRLTEESVAPLVLFPASSIVPVPAIVAGWPIVRPVMFPVLPERPTRRVALSSVRVPPTVAAMPSRTRSAARVTFYRRTLYEEALAPVPWVNSMRPAPAVETRALTIELLLGTRQVPASTSISRAVMLPTRRASAELRVRRPTLTKSVEVTV